MRALRLVLAVLLILASAGPALAQLQGPGNILRVQNAAVTVSNTTTGTNLWTTAPTIPAGMIQGGLVSSKLIGDINVLAGGAAMSLTLTIGNAAFTVMDRVLVNGALTSAPFRADCAVIPTSVTSTAYVNCEVLTGGSVSVSATVSRGTMSVTTNVDNTLQMSWAWNAASASNSLTIQNAVLTVGG